MVEVSFDHVSAGEYHTCGATTGNQAYCWGDGQGGKLGDGYSFLTRLIPTAVVGGLTFSQLSAGGYHTCGRTPDYVAYCWGENTNGALGDGTGITRFTPTPVAGGT